MKKGYKDSPLGSIPIDWEVVKLGEVAEKISSGKDKKDSNSDIPFYGSTGIIGTCSNISYKGAHILVARVGANAGSVNLINGQFGVSDNALIFKIKQDELKFVFYYLEYFNLSKLLFGTGQPLITATILKNINLLLPPLAEQKRIAEVLTTVDDKIDNIGKQIDQFTELKKGLMQQLLTKGIDHTEFKDSPLGSIPKDWEVVKLGEVAEINPSKIKTGENNLVSFIGMADTSEAAKLKNRVVKKYKDVKSGFTCFKNNDIIVAKITPCFENGKGAFVKELENGIGFGSTEFHVIRSCSHLLPLFIFYHVFSHNFREKGKLNMTGSAGQKRIGKSFIQNYLFPLPPLAEQQKIAEILGSVDRKIDILESKREKVVDQKKGLMQKLLTGEKRLPYKE